ncbi:MAG: hypothetical protein V1652_04060, partial [bacterium]
MFNWFALSGFLFGFSTIFFGLFTYLKDRHGKINQRWLYFCISTAIWGFGGAIIANINYQSYDWALFAWRVTHIGVIFIPIFFLYFMYTWLEIEKPKLIKFHFAVGSIFLGLNLIDLFFNFQTKLFIGKLAWMFNSFYWDVHPHFDIYWIFVAWWFFLVIYAHYQAVQKYKTLSGIKK